MLFFVTNDFSNFLVLFCFVILLNVGYQKSCAYVFTYTITDSNCIVDCYVLLFPDFINKKCFTLILKTMILTALANSVTSTEIFRIQNQPPEVFLKFKSKFHRIRGITPKPVSPF